MQCFQCGSNFDKDSKACPFCGKKGARRRPSKGNIRAGIALLIAVIAGTCGFFLYASWSGDAEGYFVGLIVGGMLAVLALFSLIRIG